MISLKQLFSKQYLVHTILLIILVITFLFSLITFAVTQKSDRRCFIFPSADSGNYIVEYRNLSKNAIQGDIGYFIDELLLGSTVERTKFLFTPGTKILSCFQRGNTLYLNLSNDLLSIGEGVIDIKEGMDLLKENVEKNFPKISNVEIFVNGKIAFEN